MMAATANDGPKRPLSGIPQEELARLLDFVPGFRAKQVFSWLRRGVASFDTMSNLPLALRGELAARFTLRATSVAGVQHDREAAKWQIMLAGGAVVEAVLLTDGAGRKTACLSTQAGCPVGCVFCKTGSLGFLRNLSAAEIVEQFYHLGGADGEIANIVFMGMGEPLLNLDELRRAIAVLTAGFSKRRVTVSTCGIVAGIRELAAKGPAARLAVSVPSANQALRDKLQPGCAGMPLTALKDALKAHQDSIGQRITVETALLGGVNTGERDAHALLDFAAGLDVIINLIPWNPANLRFEGRPLRKPQPAEVGRFKSMLESGGLKTVLRRKKGTAVCGACGQLGAIDRAGV